MAILTRREFIKSGAVWVAVASIPTVLRVDPAKAFAGPTDGGDLADYLKLFEVDEAMIQRVIAAALERGGDYCDLYFEHRVSNWVGLQDEAVNRAYCNIDYGVGIRVVEGDQTGYSFTEELSPEAMMNAARTASNIANQSSQPGPTEFRFHRAPDYYPVERAWESVNIDEKIPLVQEVNAKLHDKDDRITKTRVWYGDWTSRVLIANSDGQLTYDYRPMAELQVSCSAEQGSQREEGWYSLAARRGPEHFSRENLEEVASQAVRRTVVLFEAVKPEAGEMEVVLAAGFSGILLHEAIGHGMEADFNRKNESIFSDKIGKSIAEPMVSIVDDGTWPSARGALNVDDEGTDTEKTFLVRDGILRSYMHDWISSKHYGVPSTGNGRRESFRHNPIPRMRCTYMLPGPHTKDEVIGSVKKGVYCESFTNGEVHIGPGDFTFYVKNGNLIEDGKLTRPIKDINIIGNGPEVLRRMVMVADDLEMSVGSGMCGKGGQSVPVSMGLPTTKVSSITVGGVNS
ncbi:MAG TPA: TldD/PmbA family protein [Acidobacteriota bacterium]|nr:TldD/PmbA family protein [Acidobacteriota bacterium]